MNTSEYSHPDGVHQSLPQPPQKRFQIRTILVPLLFLGLHWLMMNLAATVYIIIYTFAQGIQGDTDIAAILVDTARLQQLILEQFPIITVCYAAILIPIYWIYLARSRRNDNRQLLVEKVRMKILLPAVAMMIGSLGVTSIWFNILVQMGENFPAVGKMVDDYVTQAGAFTPKVGYFWLILGVSIMAPVVEELLFRGIIQGELRKAMPEWTAIILQAVIFALFHIQPIQITYVLLPGLLLGLAYYWSKSIWVPIIMHISFNFLGSALPALIAGNETGTRILIWSEIAFILIGTFAVVYLHLNHRRKSDMIQPES